MFYSKLIFVIHRLQTIHQCHSFQAYLSKEMLFCSQSIILNGAGGNIPHYQRKVYLCFGLKASLYNFRQHTV